MENGPKMQGYLTKSVEKKSQSMNHAHNLSQVGENLGILSLSGPRLRRRLFLFVVFGVYQFGDNFSGMSAGIEVIRVFTDFLLGALLSAMATVEVLVVIEVVVLVLVEMAFRHDCNRFFDTHTRI